MDPELLEAVISRPTNGLHFEPGQLENHAAELPQGYSFPMLTRRRGARTDGVLTSGLTQDDIDRIAYFEDYEYAPVNMRVRAGGQTVEAKVFMGTPDLRASGVAWNFTTWAQRDKPVLLAVTHRVMREHYGVTPFAEIDAVWHRIKAEIEAELGISAP